jgi:hypothetical protein
MPNTSRLHRYQVSSSDNANTRVIFVRADTSSTTLSLNGTANLEAVPTSAGQTYRIVLQGRGGAKSNVSHARNVAIVMTGAAPPLSVGSRATIPVFREATFDLYQVGQTGTYLGGACRCVGKRDGAPSTLGFGS